jgi:hypothetical protein
MDPRARPASLSSLPLPLLALLAGASLAPSAPAQCIPRWVEQFAGGDLEGGSPQAFAVFDDDGAGPHAPALHAAGWFTVAGRAEAWRIAKWDGERWSPLPLPLNTAAYALAVFDDDGPGPHPSALYVGGAFTNHLGQWDGTSWATVGGGVDGIVFALAVFDDDGAGPHLPALFAGGTFTDASGVSAFNVVKWNGSVFTPLANGTSSTVRALTVYDRDGAGPAPSELVAGGDFTTAGTGNAAYVASWNGASWSPFDAGTTAPVHALATFDEDAGGPGASALFAGGAFLAAGSANANRIARWNGSAWSALVDGVDGVVDSLSVYDPDGNGPLASSLVAGGDFTAAGTVAASHVARWNGASWSALAEGILYQPGPGDPPGSAHVYALASFDSDGNGPKLPELFAGGIFTTAGDAVTRNVARWEGAAWAGLGGGLNGPVQASTVFDDDGTGPHAPALFVGGDFTSAGGRPANRIAKWDGASWSNLRVGANDEVLALTVFDADGAGPAPPALYAGGRFTDAGGAAAGIAKWDGSSWTPLSSGVTGPSFVDCMLVFDDDGAGPHAPALYVGGQFTLAGGVAVNHIAKWDGSSWSDVGGGVSGVNPPVVWAMAAFDEDGPGPGAAKLWISGVFLNAGGVSAVRIARWNGTVWSALPPGEDGFGISSFAVHDEDGAGPGLPALFVGGNFDWAGSTSAHNVARWTGSSWSAVGNGFADGYVATLASFDADGLGADPAELYAGGSFTNSAGVSINQIARWTGSSWAPLSTGMESPFAPYATVLTLCAYDDDGSGPSATSLYAGGNFGTAGEIPSAFLARRQGCGSPIESFCAGDGAIAACPCGNSGGLGRGCQNSAATGGARLTAVGQAGLALDTLQLSSSGELPSSLSIFLQGDSVAAPAVFGDGLRCVGGTLKRLFTKGASGGVAVAPSGAEPSVSLRSAERGDPLSPGSARHYQTYYRDANPVFCAAPAGSTFNISNGLSTVWGP